MLTGSKHSPETKAKMSKAKKGKPGHPMSDKTREKICRTLTGKKRSQEEIENIKRGIANSEKAKNRGYSHMRTDEWKAMVSKRCKGKKATDAAKANMVEAWKLRRAAEGYIERVAEYATDWDEIRFNVYKRDNWICQECGIKTTNARPFSKTTICCHHIDYDKENNKENNLITLCCSCHSKTNFEREDWTKYFSEKVG